MSMPLDVPNDEKSLRSGYQDMVEDKAVNELLKISSRSGRAVKALQ